MKEKIGGLLDQWHEMGELMSSFNCTVIRQMQESKDLLESSKYSVLMILNLINDLLDLAKHEKHVFKFHNSFFNLMEAIHETFKTLQFLSKKKRITTILEIDTDHLNYFVKILGDRARFE